MDEQGTVPALQIEYVPGRLRRQSNAIEPLKIGPGPLMQDFVIVLCAELLDRPCVKLLVHVLQRKCLSFATH